MVGTDGVDHAVLKGLANGLPIPLTAEWRGHMTIGVEVGDIHISQVNVMDGDVTGDGQTIRLGLAHHLHAGPAGQPAKVDPCPGLAHQQDDGGQRHGLGRHGNGRQAKASRDDAVMHHAALAQMRVLGPQPDRQVQGRGILQRMQQHPGVHDR